LNFKGASVFISGSAKNMPADVRKSIMNVIRIHGNKTEDEARSTLQLMERNGKYVVEAWS
jgi:sulfite reductase alpha subunit-like flavoprotein